jgi:hypothetical protein
MILAALATALAATGQSDAKELFSWFGKDWSQPHIQEQIAESFAACAALSTIAAERASRPSQNPNPADEIADAAKADRLVAIKIIASFEPDPAKAEQHFQQKFEANEQRLTLTLEKDGGRFMSLSDDARKCGALPRSRDVLALDL